MERFLGILLVANGLFDKVVDKTDGKSNEEEGEENESEEGDEGNQITSR